MTDRTWNTVLAFFAGCVLALAAQGCAASRLDAAIASSNGAAAVADTAAKALHEQCTMPAERLAPVNGEAPEALLERLANVAALDRYCGPASKAYGAYVATWAALVAALRVAQDRGDPNDVQLAALVQQLAAAGDELAHALAAVPR